MASKKRRSFSTFAVAVSVAMIACGPRSDVEGVAGTYVLRDSDTLALEASGHFRRAHRTRVPNGETTFVDTGRWVIRGEGRLVALTMPVRWSQQHGHVMQPESITVARPIALAIARNWRGQRRLDYRPDLGLSWVRR
jgi:hypothetical protein